MCAEKEVGLAADRLADQSAEFGAELERNERGLARIEDRIGSSRIEFDGGEALLHIMGGAFSRDFGIPVDRAVLPLGGVGIEISVGAQALMHASAQQFIDGLA